MKIPTNWTFESDVIANGFDRHVREQLPWYDLATNAITHIARHYIPQDGVVYDIGASTGNIGKAIEPILKTRNAKLVGIEPSKQMIEKYNAPGEVICAKAEEIEFEPFDLAIVFLTMMFIEPSKRAGVISNLQTQCREGGAIIIFDKVESEGGYLSTVFYRLTLAGKRAAGVDASEIIEKELSLSGVQRPIKNLNMTHNAHLWFKFGDFSGYIIEK